MKNLMVFLVAITVGFGIFSAVLGAKHEKLRRGGYLSFSYDRSPADERAMASIQSVAKAVSIPFFASLLGAFILALRKTRRKLAIVGIVVSLFMTLWSLVLSGAVSFDEVYLAWVAAAIVLVVLELAVFRPVGGTLETAAA